ncbi:MAG: hypothetical protein UR12_C0049G0002 [candidate division TM6 bacterium GW2011_GWF2_30_66]|jgi:hypothetical protein|nr:MAG: hypothetical protein UR12_C0049G0002 [candidate division TM6 bacterium GW2011_GWF2_30_66]
MICQSKRNGTCGEPYVGKLQVRFGEGFHSNNAIIVKVRIMDSTLQYLSQDLV